ncbi:hypothetical protein SE18_12805 [Herpetosiphon geysericola]|uniref:Secreted protein n=1 Tax=Herpetosiphon geysericola TaxID=70996 RepID=A0A0P6XTW5_9CHLR|nr:hypothetical protein SE18_12805 [Herpetosiphon geysericola]
MLRIMFLPAQSLLPIALVLCASALRSIHEEHEGHEGNETAKTAKIAKDVLATDWRRLLISHSQKPIAHIHRFSAPLR